MCILSCCTSSAFVEWSRFYFCFSEHEYVVYLYWSFHVSSYDFFFVHPVEYSDSYLYCFSSASCSSYYFFYSCGYSICEFYSSFHFFNLCLLRLSFLWFSLFFLLFCHCLLLFASLTFFFFVFSFFSSFSTVYYCYCCCRFDSC